MQNEQQTPASPRLYAAEGAKAFLKAGLPGLEDEIAPWAGRDVILATCGDIARAQKERRKNPYRFLKGEMKIMFTLMAGKPDPSNAWLLRSLIPDLSFPGLEEFVARGNLDYRQSTALRSGKAEDGGIIIINEAQFDDPLAFPGALTGLPKSMLRNIPDPEGRAWRSMLMAHEARHLRQQICPFDTRGWAYRFWIMEGEIDADKHALTTAFNASATDVVRAWKGVRAIGGILSGGSYAAPFFSAHMTAPAQMAAAAGSVQAVRGLFFLNSAVDLFLSRLKGHEPEAEHAVVYFRNSRRVTRPLMFNAALKAVHDGGLLDGEPVAKAMAADFIAAMDVYVAGAPEAAQKLAQAPYCAAILAETAKALAQNKPAYDENFSRWTASVKIPPLELF